MKSRNVVISLAALLVLVLLLSLGGVVPPGGTLLLAGAAIGVLVGWLAAPRVPVWLPVVPIGLAIVAFVIGMSQYNDDGQSGPLFEPMLIFAGRVAPAALALIAGAAVVGTLRRRPA
jgi:hypothetical protein